MVGASGRAGKTSKAQKRGIFLVSDKRQKRTQIILTSKTSMRVAVWLALAVELVTSKVQKTALWSGLSIPSRSTQH